MPLSVAGTFSLSMPPGIWSLIHARTAAGLSRSGSQPASVPGWLELLLHAASALTEARHAAAIGLALRLANARRSVGLDSVDRRCLILYAMDLPPDYQ
jgi:hypothetical protein